MIRKGAMTEKSRTTVVVESHEQTIIRRSRRAVSSGEFPIAAESGASFDAASPVTDVAPVPRELSANQNYGWFGRWLRSAARRGATAFASRRPKVSSNERRSKQP